MSAIEADETAIWSDDRAFVERELRRAEEAALAAHSSPDEYELDRCYKVVLALENLLLELEDRDARAEERGARAWYRWASL